MYVCSLSNPGRCTVQRLESIPRAACLLCELLHVQPKEIEVKKCNTYEAVTQVCASNSKHDFQHVFHKDSWSTVESMKLL